MAGIAATIGAAARGAGSAILEDVLLVDRYLPAGEDGPRNWTLRFTFRHPSKTLKDKDVDKEMERLHSVLQQAAASPEAARS